MSRPVSKTIISHLKSHNYTIRFNSKSIQSLNLIKTHTKLGKSVVNFFDEFRNTSENLFVFNLFTPFPMDLE